LKLGKIIYYLAFSFDNRKIAISLAIR